MSPPNKRQRVDSDEDDGLPSGLPPLSLSILGVDPIDEFIKQIADFVHHLILKRPDVVGNIEVEAKIGVLRHKGSSQRLTLPVLNETILAPNGVECRFESNMSQAQHKHFNELLNTLRTTTADSSNSSSPLDYMHLRHVDTIFPNPSPQDRGAKTRVTTDEKTGAVVECIRKIKLGNLDIFNPNRDADWRVSVNLEVPAPRPPEDATPEHTRRKDRMSYSHEEFAIDLTQVTSRSNGATELLHELEVEIARPDFLLSTALQRGDPNLPEHARSAFDELIRAFVNNARILARNANNGWQ